MPFVSPPEILLVALIVILLFGAKKLPDAARSLGRSMRILKAETKGLHEDDAPKPLTGAAGNVPAARFDPVTGEPVARFDPVTGQPLDVPGTNDRP